MPVRRVACPRIVVSRHGLPLGPLMLSQLSPACDRARRLAGGKLAEDAPHDDSFRLDDLATATNRRAVGGTDCGTTAVAVSLAAAALALPHPPFKSSMGLYREVLEEQGVHRALQSDMKFADLAFGAGEIMIPRNDICLKSAAVASWSRDRRSSPSATTTSNLSRRASANGLWYPGRIVVAPDIARSL